MMDEVGRDGLTVVGGVDYIGLGSAWRGRSGPFRRFWDLPVSRQEVE